MKDELPAVRASGEPQKLEALLRAAWEEGFNLRGGYADNWPHFQGEQKERQWASYIQRTPEVAALLQSASASPSDDGARQPQDEAWQIMHRIYRKVCEMTVGLPMPTTAFYDFGVPIIAEELATLRARIVVLETSVDSLRYLIDHPVTQQESAEPLLLDGWTVRYVLDEAISMVSQAGNRELTNRLGELHNRIEGKTLWASVPSSPAGR